MAEDTQVKPEARVIEMDACGKNYLPILAGPPETYSMRSGMVVLAPRQAVGRHSTKQFEELLIILAGRGEMVFGDGRKLALQSGQALYCPPQTEHDVFNNGTGALRYVYVVARAL